MENLTEVWYNHLIYTKRGVNDMTNLFEKQDSLNAPIETFYFNSADNEFPVKPHWHYFAEFLYILEGSAEITCDGVTYTVSKGELIILQPSTVHSIGSADGGLPLFAGLKFDPVKFPNMNSYAPSASNIFRYARDCGMRTRFTAEEAEALHCREIFGDCIAESESYLYGREMILRAQIYRLIFGIVRIWIKSGLEIDRCPITPDGLCGIENITEYIDARLDENIRVADIAARCHMSYSGFATKFREQYGMSCKEYIERMRIFKAEEYLLFTDHDLSYISQQTGFSDQSHFIRSFKKFRGITPKQFRNEKKHNGQQPPF
ncbi:MAG: helix-turn-helix transcriptional regulator [Ruminococcus sp.]|nr:helix-turn-helix transcriptional regulator [Ruminococcus sp.]